MIVYGIKNCNTVKKAISWLEANQISYEFHDYKKKGISPEKLREWCGQTGAELLINRKGTTWRKFDDGQKEKAEEQKQAIELMATHTSVIKRPLIEQNGQILAIGFDEKEYEQKFT